MSSSQLYASGLASYRATSFETAIELFTSAIALDPTQAKLYDARAGAYEQVGRLKDALGDVREVVRLLPGSYKGFLRGGRLWKKAGKLEKAEKMLVQGLGKVEGGGKVREEFEKELSIVRDLIFKASYSPISRLPADLFLDIILLASTSSPREWNSFPTPRSKNPAPNPLLSAMHVSRTWYSAISSSPRLWSTLAIDGVINRKNAVEKAVWWSRRARGRRQGEDDAKDDAKGLKKIVVTAASEINPVTFVRLYEALKKEEAVGDLREFTISFVDGALNTFEATQASMSLAFLWEACESSLETLIYATEAKVHLQLDILRLGTKFPSLRDLRIWGGTGATVSLDSQALSKGCRSTDLKAPPPLVHLALHNCPVYGQKVELSDFPALRNLDLHITDATALWNILSTPSLKSCRLRVPPSYDFATPRQTNVSSAWRVIEDLALIGRSTIICTLLDLAVAANLALPFLTTLDLTGARLTDPRLSLFDSLNAPLLTSLNLRNSTYSPDPPFPSLHSLLSLNVANTSWTTDDFVRSLIAKTPRITQLNLSGNPLLTGRPIMELVRFRAPEEGSRSELVELRLEGCVGIETSAVEWLRKAVRPGGVRFMFMEAKEKAAKRPRLR